MSKSSYKKNKIRKRVIAIVLSAVTWIGVAIIYYVIFSLFFDTPIEYEIRKSNQIMQKEYNKISQKFDSLSPILKSIENRDANLYNQLFGSNPPQNESEDHKTNKEGLLKMSNNDLAELLFNKINDFNRSTKDVENNFAILQNQMLSLGNEINKIPSIQPINNSDLTKLSASFGYKINPFLKSFQKHTGVDFAITEDSPVYATADGVISKVGSGSKGEGLMVEIVHSDSYLDHGDNIYRTTYAHLNKAAVKKGEVVRRGEIIGYSGSSGLVFLPNLHYEIYLNDKNLDPIEYFFYELDPTQSEKLKAIGKSRVQSLD